MADESNPKTNTEKDKSTNIKFEAVPPLTQLAETDESSPENMNQFISGKVKNQYENTGQKLQHFITTSNQKEQHIQRKMLKIQSKYSKINRKLKKLERTKERLMKGNDVKSQTEPSETEQNNNLSQSQESTRSPTGKDNSEKVPSIVDPGLWSCEVRIGPVDSGGEEYSEAQQETSQPGDKARLGESDLCDGLRVLVRLCGVLHPGRLTPILPPDIYGVKVDRERGDRPHVFSREELLSRVVSMSCRTERAVLVHHISRRIFAMTQSS